MDVLTSIATAFGLSASAGLNAYIPLFILAILARFTNLITLSSPYDVLTNTWVIIALGALMAVEFFADKIPLVDHANDVIGTFVRPVAGALLFAASTGAVSGMQPAVAVIAGLLVAGSVHATKATVRPAVTATTGGLGNPVVSTAEDFAAVVVSIGAIVLPLLMALALVIVAIFAFWALWRFRSRRATS